MANQQKLVEHTYEVLLGLVEAGRISKEDLAAVLVRLDDEWRQPQSARRLAAALVEYAREQAAEPPEVERVQIRKRRLYAVTQQLYERLRLSPAQTVGVESAPPASVRAAPTTA
jgi:hypothetical protein